MFRFLQPSISWLLIAVVLTGHLPALLHRADCTHGCVLSANCDISCTNSEMSETRVSETRAEGTARLHSCCKSQASSASEPVSDHPEISSEHRCEDCTICQSILTSNGFMVLSGNLVASEALRVGLPTLQQFTPELSRFGISQSRAPPRLLG